MVCRRSSSGTYSQESQRWASSRRFKVQCATTLHGEKKEIQKYENTSHRQLRNMLVNSRAVIGLSWSMDQKRNGMEPTPTNPTDPGTEWQKKWWQLSLDPVIRHFVPSVALWERRIMRQRREKEVYRHFNGSDENIELLLRTVISANQLSVLRSNSRFMQRIIQRS